MSRSRPRQALLVATAASLLIAATGCGTSLKRSEIERAVGAPGSGSLSSSGVVGDNSAGASTAGSGGIAGTGGVGGTSGGGTASGGTASGGTASGGTASGGTTSGGTTSASGGPGGSTSGGNARSKPITIAAVSTLSGVTAVSNGITYAVQAWTGMVNANGGIAGHPVKLIVVDDAGDSNRHLQLVKQMVEQYKVIAFVGNVEAGTQSQQAVSYLESKGVPTIGDDSRNRFGYKSKMIFPAVAAAEDFSVAATFGLAQLAKKKNLKKAGLLTCVEVSVCQDAYNNWEKDMNRVGLTPVYKTQTSVTQPDFTAQCIQARNAGTEVLNIAMDFNSVRRVISSCRQQGFNPTFNTPQVAPGIEKEDLFQNLFIAWVTFSPFVADTPAIKEFQGAMGRYKADAGLDLEQSLGWTGAKLFEKALTNAKLGSGAVTSADVLRGLWTINNDTLGGLTGPLTFTKDHPAKRVFCYIGITIKDKKYVNPFGSSPTCAARPKL